MNTSIGVVAIDDGGSSTCVVTKNRHEMFPSIKGLYGNRNLTVATGKHDYIVDYKGEKYVLGNLAKYDCAYPMQMHSETKQHDFYDLSVLTSVHQFGYADNYIVVSVPIEMHNDNEKKGRIARLRGKHTLTVNGITRTFTISDVRVAPETAVAYWNKETKGKTRYIDLGSRTIGYATTVNEHDDIRFIDTESGTLFGMGIEALGKNYNPKGLADLIYGKLSMNWSRNDDVFILGGGALDEELVSYLKYYFPNAVVMDNPKMANAYGMYVVGRLSYDMA
jgi:plasmid segregation protein ParM